METACVEASEERWVKLMSKSMYSRNSRLSFLCNCRAASRDAHVGEMKLESATMPPSAKSLETSATRRMFSARSEYRKRGVGEVGGGG